MAKKNTAKEDIFADVKESEKKSTKALKSLVDESKRQVTKQKELNEHIKGEQKKVSKIKEIKVAKKPVERLEGVHMVNFCSNGLSRYLRKAGKIHVVTADHAQVLIDKGYGHVV